eukprot:TRINITY_DN10655_c0_g1_i1.p1 TRINITY_DN10655_c0_g1~~TRINITY_DN10655_c0_g1_i1.p1  ORF type:complete len:179 (+),score=48.52 TRINITY_DN10655_c0_g1_i1:105-641(+)
MIRRPPRSTLSSSSAASDVYKRQEWSTLTAEKALHYVFHPSILFTFALLAVSVWETNRGKLVALTASERMRARWYLLNGVIIHILMDGMVGVFKVEPLFAKNYNKLDRRYGSAIGTFEGSTVHIVSLLELFVKGPLCILLYRAYHRGTVSYTHLRAHETPEHLVCRLLLEKKKKHLLI